MQQARMLPLSIDCKYAANGLFRHRFCACQMSSDVECKSLCCMRTRAFVCWAELDAVVLYLSEAFVLRFFVIVTRKFSA